MTTETMIHVPASKDDAAIATEFLSLYTRKYQDTFGEHITVGAYLGEGMWELIDWTDTGEGGFAVVGMFVAPGTVVGRMWFEPVGGASPVVRWERTA
jgi:hypothetical protein